MSATLDLTQRIAAELEQECVVRYDGHIVGRVRLPILVEGQLLVQLCTDAELPATATFPLASYLQAAGLRLGLLVNLQSSALDIRRVERPSLAVQSGGGQS